MGTYFVIAASPVHKIMPDNYSYDSIIYLRLQASEWWSQGSHSAPSDPGTLTDDYVLFSCFQFPCLCTMDS